MTQREDMQKAHEDDVIHQFVHWLNSTTSSRLQVIARPNPPDAVLGDESGSFWVELADVYRGGEEAHEERSTLNPGENRYFHSEHPIQEADSRTAIAFVRTMQKKLQKSSYDSIFKKCGLGILILTERDPLFTESTVERIREEVAAYDFSGDRSYFKEIYLGYRSRGGLWFEKIDYNRS